MLNRGKQLVLGLLLGYMSSITLMQKLGVSQWHATFCAAVYLEKCQSLKNPLLYHIMVAHFGGNDAAA